MEVIAEGAVFMDGMDGSACHWLPRPVGDGGQHGGHRRSTGRASDGPTKENDRTGDTAMTERRHLEQCRHGRSLSRGCNGRGNRSSPARPLLWAYIVREGEVVCCAEGTTRGACGNWGGQKRRSVCSQRCSLRVGVFNGGVDWDDKSEPIICRWATRAKPTKPSWPGVRAYTPTGERQRDRTACPCAL